MNERKTEVVNLRMTPRVKGLLRTAASQEHRTLSNMLEVLIEGYFNPAETSAGSVGQRRGARTKRASTASHSSSKQASQR